MILDLVLELYGWVLLAMVIVSWLIALNILNTRQPAVMQVENFLRRLTEPVLNPIRRFVPMMSGLDLSPLIVWLIIIFVRSLLREYALIGF